MSGSWSAWKDRLLFWVCTALVMGAVSWASWMTIRAFNSPTTEQTIELIKSRAPYIEDRKAIQEQLTRSEESNKALREVISKNTEAINALRLEIAKMPN